MSNITKGKQLDELSNTKLAQYKTAAAADASKADSEGDYKRGNKRFSGINKATMKQFDNDSKGVDEGSTADYRQFFDKEDAAMKKNKSNYSTQAPSFRSKQEYDNWIEKNNLGDRDMTRTKDDTEEKVRMKETNNNYHANRTGFSRGQRDDERHDLDTASPQVWGLKIKGNVWSKNGKDVTFTSKEAATKSMNSILKMHPDLQGKIGLVTKGGQQGVAEGAEFDSNYAEQLAQYVYNVKPELDSEDDVLNIGYKVAVQDLASQTRAVSLFSRDQDFPSDFISAYRFLQKNQGLTEGETWSKHNNKRVGGMSKKSVSSYRRSHPGSKIQTAVTTKPSKLKKGSKAAKRRKSFCARMKGMKKSRTSAKTARDPNSNINKSLRRWNCESIEEMQELIMIAEQQIKQAKLEQEGLKQDLWEEWSQKYKSSINCSHPKGFSQKAHCAGKKKHNESTETHVMEMVCEDCGMCETHGDHSRDTLDEACWKGYHKEGNKKMFGKTYPNCVKNEDVSEGADLAWDDPDLVQMRKMIAARKAAEEKAKQQPAQKVTPAKAKRTDKKIAEDSGYDGSQPLDLDTKPSVNDVFKRALYIYDYEGYGNDGDYSEDDAIDQYVRRQFGEKVLNQLEDARYRSYFGREGGNKGGHIRSSNLGTAGSPGDKFRTTKTGKMHGQDAKMMKNKIADRLGRHPEPVLPEDMSRRGFLRGMGAAALAGAAGVSQANQQQDLGNGFVLTTVNVLGETFKAVMDTENGLTIIPNRRPSGGALIRSQARFLTIKDSKIADTSMSVGPGTMAALQKAGLLSNGVDEGYRVVPDINRERYTERPGLEGPFRTNHGKVVYYDKREGKYYDPDSDMYISHDDYQAMNEAKKIDQSKPRNFVAKNAKMGGAGEHKDKKKAMKQGDMKHKSKDAELAEVVAESSIMQGLKKV